MSVQQATEFFRIPGIPGLSHETVQSQPTDEQEIHLLVASKQLSTHVKIGVKNSSSVQHPDSNVERGAMAIVDAETLERACEGGCVFDYIVPEPRIVFRTGTVPKFYTITPNDDLSTEVRLRRWRGKVFEGIRVPDPTIVGQGILEGIRFGLRQASKVRLHKG